MLKYKDDAPITGWKNLDDVLHSIPNTVWIKGEEETHEECDIVEEDTTTPLQENLKTRELEVVHEHC